MFGVTIQTTAELFISYLRDSFKVKNGQRKYIIVASVASYVSITHHFKTPGEINLASNNSNRCETNFQIKVCC